MRFIAVDWGTSRLRAYRVEDGAVVARAASEEGIATLKAGEHAAAFRRLCGAWLAEDPGLAVALVGMVGSREGWMPAPYVPCPAGPAEIASGLLRVEIGDGRHAVLVPGLIHEADGAVDVMRGEETHALGAGLQDGIAALPGTHCKWAEISGGRIVRFATFMTGELYALLRAHSMIGRPAAEPADPAGFALGLAAARGGGAATGGLAHLLFGARAATVAGRLSAVLLGPYLSGLLTGHEIEGARGLLGKLEAVTVVADEARYRLYAEALAPHGTRTSRIDPETTFTRGVAAILGATR